METNELKQWLRHQIDNAEGGPQSTLAEDRKNALERYYMRPSTLPAPDGGSRIIVGEVSATVDAIVAHAAQALTTDCLAEFDQDSEQDDSAYNETKVCETMLFGKNNGTIELQTAVKNSCLMRAGYVKHWIEEQKIVTVVTHQFKQPADAVGFMTQLIASKPENVTYELIKSDIPNTLKIKTITTEQTFKSKAIPPENIGYTPNWNSTSFQEVPFLYERHEVLRGDLIKMGFRKDKVNRLAKYGNDIGPIENIRYKDQKTPTQGDPATDVIEAYECYVLVDEDGDGIPERHVIWYSGNTTLKNELTDVVPYSNYIGIIDPHKATGISIADKVSHIQDINSALARTIMNNAAVANRSRVIYDINNVNGEDLTNPNPQSNIGVDGSPADNVMPLQVPDLSAGLLQSIQWFTNKRDEMAGSSLQISTGETQIGNNVGSQGLDRMFSAREMLAAQITQNVAQTGVRESYLITHHLLRTQWIGPINVKVAGKWVQQDPSNWKQRLDLTIKVGMSNGQRMSKINALQQIITLQGQLAQAGLSDIVVDARSHYNALVDLCRAQYITNPEQYYLDPDSDKAKAAVQAQNQARAASEQQNKQLLAQAVQLEEMRSAIEKYKIDTGNLMEAWKTQFEGAIKLMTTEATSLSAIASKFIGNNLNEQKPATGTGSTAKTEPAMGNTGE